MNKAFIEKNIKLTFKWGMWNKIPNNMSQIPKWRIFNEFHKEKKVCFSDKHKIISEENK